MEEIRIKPTEDGRWNWHRSEDDEVIGEGPGFDVRAACIEAARTEGGAEKISVTRESGLVEDLITPARCRIVLLRIDGSEVGELDPPPGDGSAPVTVTLTPPPSLEEARTDG
jgi:hypothetical protein